jgi:hypothetical protein
MIWPDPEPVVASAAEWARPGKLATVGLGDVAQRDIVLNQPFYINAR